MPANYALHRFGNEAIRHLPTDTQRLAQRFRRVFNGGLHAQDLFFYYSVMRKSAVGSLYGQYNRMTGRDYFAQACGLLKQNPSEAGTACLYGMLAHYCLKSCLAPLMAAETADGSLSRVELEVELDRYLLFLDNRTPAHRQDLTAQLKMTQGECVTVSGFFPPATEKQYYRSYRHMLRWVRRMAAKRRRFLRFLLGFARRDFCSQLMPDCANHKCIHLDKPLLECYERALERYPAMARQLTEYREKGIPLGEEFDAACE